MKKIHTFHASSVYGYLDMDIKFFPKLTFLYGLNGSGKTTALRLIMGLLEPSLITLLKLPYRNAILKGEAHQLGKVTVHAKKDEKYFTLGCSMIKKELQIPLTILQTEDSDTTIERTYGQNPVIEAIKKITAPIFLGIDRRFMAPLRSIGRIDTLSSRELAFRFRRERMLAEKKLGYDRGLAEVAELIDRAVRNMRIKEETVDDNFRKQLLLESFSYVAPSTRGLSTRPPTEKAFRKFRIKKSAISRALQNLGLDSLDFEKKSEDFFKTMEGIINTIQTKKKKKDQKDKEKYIEALAAWFLNQHQVNYIDRLFNSATNYQQQREKIYEPLNDFEELINKFFCQTGKKISITHESVITISLPQMAAASIQSLSSGERQIFIMLAHLSLNPNLLGDGVFIVDEPELSLHMSWQDMFVDALVKANPHLQLILATHAPAIIGGRNDLCVPVSKMEAKNG